jgi:hypothetical protein
MAGPIPAAAARASKISEDFYGLFGALCYIPAPLKHWPFKAETNFVCEHQ